MAGKNQKLLLFLDKCVAHARDASKLRNVQVEFLPVNTTLGLQPMDQRIIGSLKHKYHRCLVWKFMQKFTTTKECYKASLSDAISMLTTSWITVSWGTTANCYWKAEFCETSEPQNEEDDGSEVSPCIWEHFQGKMKVAFTFKEYEDADNLLPCAVQEIDDLCIEDKNTEIWWGRGSTNM
jgi:hypothetical protein